MKKIFFILSAFLCVHLGPWSARPACAQDNLSGETIFDDKLLLEGYTQKYTELPQDIILEMIKDDNLGAFKSAAAVRVFRQKYLPEIALREKHQFERYLLRRLKLTDSPFVEVEILHTLCVLDRYRYFKTTVPALIQKLDHYNSAVNAAAFASLNDIIESGDRRAREARIIFNTLRKVLFLSRRRLAEVTEPDERLSQKLKLLRWSIKVLGRQELKRLPNEVISLL